MRLETAIFAAALAMTGVTGAAVARDGSLDDGRGGGRGDAGRDDGYDERDHDDYDYDHEELSCVEAYGGWGRQHEVTVADEGGRLIATVAIVDDWGDGRIVLRAGVDLRPAGGRDLDTLYVGRNVKIAVDSYTGDGLLDYTLNGRRTRVALACY
jgi:hypothetical protein